MMKGIRHTGIVVKDLNKALHFYQDLLGLKIVKDKVETGPYIDKILSLENAKVRTIKMAAENGDLIELLYFQSHLPDSRKEKKAFDIGFSNIAFTVNNVEEIYKKLQEQEKEIKFNSSPQRSPKGYAKVVFCKDPEGNLIEFTEVIVK